MSNAEHDVYTCFSTIHTFNQLTRIRLHIPLSNFMANRRLRVQCTCTAHPPYPIIIRRGVTHSCLPETTPTPNCLSVIDFWVALPLLLSLYVQAALVSVILPLRLIDIYMCLSADFRRCKRLQRPGYRHAARRNVSINSVRLHCGCIHNTCIFPSALCGCH